MLKRILGVAVRLFVGFASLSVIATAGMVADAWTAFGKAADGLRMDRMSASPQWAAGGFVNPQPMFNDVWGSITDAVPSEHAEAAPGDVPILKSDGAHLQALPDSGLRLTWLGHSTTLIEIDGVRLLTDPIFGERASPWDWVGPKRWYAPPIPLDGLPALDAVLISHDHYDHLQVSTVMALKDHVPLWIVPLGVGAHLEYWGVSADRIVELDWWDEHVLDGLTVAATPSRHASGRHLLDQGDTLWASFALVGPEHRVWFSGDTGMFPGVGAIGDRYGPFDVTMIEVGAYSRNWPDWHIGPEQAIDAHEQLRGDVFMPIHWGLWNLAMHGWTEPAERVLAAAEGRDVRVALPKPGGSVEPSALPAVERWWPSLPWQSAAEHPVVSTRIGDAD